MPREGKSSLEVTKLVALGGDYEPYPGRVCLTFEDAGGQIRITIPLEDARRLCAGLDALLADFDNVRITPDPDSGSAKVSFDG
jgi:hypothetical protein